MKLMNVEHYVYESVFVTISQDHPIEIDAHNEFYFLQGWKYLFDGNRRGFTLISAENCILELESEANMNTAIHTEHFSGKISISINPFGYISGDGDPQNAINGKCTLNFLRVTPTAQSNENIRNQN
jgi:hypothetical protein